MDCCCHKTKHRSDEEQKKLTHRLNRIEVLSDDDDSFLD